MKKTTEPTIYKFEFYAQVHPWLAEDFKKDLKEQVDEALCYVDELQQLTKIQQSMILPLDVPSLCIFS